MAYSIRRIGSMYCVVRGSTVCSNLFSNPFEFKMTNNDDKDDPIATELVFNHFKSRFLIIQSTRKIGFPRVYYHFGTHKRQLGLIDNGILVVTIPCLNPMDYSLDLDEIQTAKQDLRLNKCVIKNRDLILKVVLNSKTS